ncbi:MAG TPA: DUF480 domain-containing protein, partial [Microthrixaceae bacterium]|nr:DUF480 domain-containing protein [Microthrixaceae bacterium]
ELRSRTERMHAFGDVGSVEATLGRLAVRSDRPLVRLLERAPGQREARWIQLLQHDADGRAEASASAGAGGGDRGSASPRDAAGAARIDDLEARVVELEAQVARLVAALDGLIDPPS